MNPKYQRTGERPFRSRGRGGHRGAHQSTENYLQSKDQEQVEQIIPDTPTVAMFREFAEKLDAKNDLYELLVKSSRDTTIEAKRIIFLLIRCAGRHPGSVEVAQILSEAKDRLLKLESSAICLIAKLLIGEDPFVFHRAFTPGLQEYIEALSFYFFIENGKLISLDEVHEHVTFSEDDTQFCLPVTPLDFLLGIGDLTGELMRFGITHASNSTTESTVFVLCDFVRAILMEYQRIPYGVGKDFGLKLKVMLQSVFKIERVCYQLSLRKSENLPVLPGFLLQVDETAEDPTDNGREVY